MQLFSGKQYLQIDIANNYGLDKLTWNERLDWFEANKHRLHELIASAADPALYYAGVKAWEAVEAGQPIGYPISLDATSSGLQILAALTGDRSAAELCNVVPFDFGPKAEAERRDGYTVIYNRMIQRMQSLKIPVGNISRDDTKSAIMTSLYGSQAVPKEIFGEGMQLKIFYEIMNEVAPAAWELNEAFLSMWDPDALSNDWVLPDNFHVHVKVMAQEREVVQFLNEPIDTYYMTNRPTKEGRSLGANCVHSIDGMIVREIARRCDYNVDKVLRVMEAAVSDSAGGLGIGRPDDKMVEILWNHFQESGYLSARILDHLDLGNMGMVDKQEILDLINSLPEKPFKVLSVHDCFRVLPNYGNDLRKQYNLQLMLIAKSNLLQYLLSQICGRQLKIGKLDPTLYKDIADTEYALS